MQIVLREFQIASVMRPQIADNVIVRATAAASPSGDPLDFVMSDETVDRFGDVIVAKGWALTNFRKNPIALFNHASSFPIGRWRDVKVQGKELVGRLELVGAEASERIAELHALVAAGVLRAVSVGFRSLKTEPLEGSTVGGIRFLETELVECSLVSVPANPNAVQIAKSLNLSDATMGLIFGEPADNTGPVLVRSGPPILRGEPAASNPAGSRNPTMNLAEQIAASEARLLTLRDQQTALIGNVDGNADDAALASLNTLNQGIEREAAFLEAFKKAERNLALGSTPVRETTTVTVDTGPAGQRRPFAVAKKEVKVGDYVLRAAVVAALAHIQKKPPMQVLVERYGEDEPTRVLTEGLVTRAASVPATTTLTGWAAELFQTSIGEFFDSLMPEAVYAQLAPLGLRLTLGRNGQISLPTRASTPTVAGSFIAEGAPIPVRQAAFASVVLGPKKMGVITTFTREIAEHSTPAIETLLRQFIAEDTSVSIDTVLIDATAVSSIRPAGLRNGVTVTTATAGGGFAALVGDIKALVGVLAAANSLRRPVWIMNPVQLLSASLTQNAGGDFPFQGEVAQGRLAGYPVIASTTVTAGMVILIDAADFVSLNGDDPRFEVSDQAVLHMEDTTPLAIGTTGAPNVVAAPVRSMFQTDSLALRMILPMNWAMRRTGVVAWTQSVTW